MWHLEWSTSLFGEMVGEGWDGGNIGYCVVEFRISD